MSTVLSMLTHFYIMQAPHINSYQNRAVNFGIQPNRVRLAPNGTNLGLLKISSSTFWLGEPKCTKANLNKGPRFVPFGANVTKFGANLENPGPTNSVDEMTSVWYCHS